MNACANTELSPIDAAAMRLNEAKVAENKAKAERLAAEDALIAIVGHKVEGATSVDATAFKITTTGSLTRSVDAAALAAIKSEIPEAVYESVFRFKPDVSLTELRNVEKENPELYAVLAQAITVKPAKTAVSLKPLE